MGSYKRVYTGYNPIRKYNGLNKKQAFELELEIYKRIGNYENFPKLISYNTNKLELLIEHCGQSLDKLNKIKIDNLDEQILNIIDVLVNNKIVHLDLHQSGKNVCYKDGKIYMIDFDIAVIDNKPMSNIIRAELDRYKHDKVFERIKSIFDGKLK